ncbi:MAG: tRNA-(ms[2]io[6]A)-hydroxylase [Patiriisocius sp.]|jgi:tRNA-(ms[2]io[6]A)-hydroxylase
MLGLKMATDPRWVGVAEKNIEEVLTDHAWCEQKACSNAISMVTKFHDKPDLVAELLEIAREELEHFKMVTVKLEERGLKLGAEGKDQYVNDIRKYIRRGGDKTDQLVDSLLFSAMIEARSCERFKLLSEEISDPDLQRFYRGLMESEAGHYATFLNYARKYGDREAVDKRWQEFLEFEGQLITSYGVNSTMHG